MLFFCFIQGLNLGPVMVATHIPGNIPALVAYKMSCVLMHSVPLAIIIKYIVLLTENCSDTAR